VRVKVRTGDRRDTKRMRIARAARSSSEAAAGRTLARASAFSCSDWYLTSKTAFAWQTSSSWWEFYCFDQGFKGTHLADWWDLYFYNAYGYQQYYGTWTRYHADGCFYYWDATAGSNWGPYC
jgi:hypothetical protein